MISASGPSRRSLSRSLYFRQGDLEKLIEHHRMVWRKRLGIIQKEKGREFDSHTEEKANKIFECKDEVSNFQRF